MTSIVYLGCPYTSDSKTLREVRWLEANMAAAYLVTKGLIVFSPISMSHGIDTVLAARNSAVPSEFWYEFDEAFMEPSSAAYFLTLPGWQHSEGIKREVKFFRERERPMFLLERLLGPGPRLHYATTPFDGKDFERIEQFEHEKRKLP